MLQEERPLESLISRLIPDPFLARIGVSRPPEYT